MKTYLKILEKLNVYFKPYTNMYFKKIKNIHKSKTEQILKGNRSVHFYNLVGGERMLMSYTKNIMSWKKKSYRFC